MNNDRAQHGDVSISLLVAGRQTGWQNVSRVFRIRETFFREYRKKRNG